MEFLRTTGVLPARSACCYLGSYCAVRNNVHTPTGTAQSGGEPDEGRRPAPLGRGPGGGLRPCVLFCARARAFPTNGAVRTTV
jgi:hypothetical protein